jgi:hypothetical protein
VPAELLILLRAAADNSLLRLPLPGIFPEFSTTGLRAEINLQLVSLRVVVNGALTQDAISGGRLSL